MEWITTDELIKIGLKQETNIVAKKISNACAEYTVTILERLQMRFGLVIRFIAHLHN
jgi:hypothetical protein